tara:strand:+ start:206 stop:577 length:372 start_codon:yes stop_codon:yes gene_type:complete
VTGQNPRRQSPLPARLVWSAVLVATALLFGHPLTLAFLVPVLALFWLLPRTVTHLAGALATLAHLALALVIVTADAPDENRAFAPLTMVLVDLVLLGACALAAPALRRLRKRHEADSYGPAGS